MTGVVRAAETPQEVLNDTLALPVDEEPPQEKVSESAEPSDLFDQNIGRDEKVVPGEGAAVSLESPTIETDGDVRKSESQESNIQEPDFREPTLEDAEKLIEESPAQLEVSGDAPVSQVGTKTSELPSAPEAHVIIPQLETENEVRGIDTVNLEQPQGNWLFKRYWWERAQELYEKMRAHVEKINDMRVKFFARRTELDKTILDPFYLDIGLTQVELQSSLQSITAQLEKERKEDGMLSEEERDLADALQKDRERLEQLQRDVLGVGAMRDAADKIVDRVVEQRNRVSLYETEAWESAREIGRIVSDTQASQLYYRMHAGWGTIKDIYAYLERDVNSSLDKLLANAKEQTERIKLTLQALKEQGVDLKARMQQAQEQEIQQEKAIEDKEKDKKRVAPQKTGWFASTSRIFQAVIDVAIWQFLQSIWDVLMWLPRRIYSTLTSLFR